MTEDQVQELLERLEKAEIRLNELRKAEVAAHDEPTAEWARLIGKMEGVALARSYLEEYLR